MGDLSDQRSPRGHRLRPFRRLAAALAAAALLASAGCSPKDKADDAAGPAWRAPEASPTPVGSVTITPNDGATNVSVHDKLVLTTDKVTLDSVTVVDNEGRPVKGKLSDDKLGWKSAGALKYRTSYTATATGIDTGGKQVTQTSKFTTVKPANLTLPYLQANAGLSLSARKTYGVGQPIVVRFDEKIPDRKAAEKALEVTTEPRVPGAWHWFTDQETHWRPQKYWAPGTDVTVKAKVYGTNLGGGLYGQEDVSASFSIGDKKVAIADDNTDHIQVFINDKLARTVPTSMGKHETVRGKDGRMLDFRTRSGVHVVLGTAPVTKMTGASWGLSKDDDYDVNSRFTTHLSYAGEYLHERTENVAKHGRENDSHGCLNLGTNDSKWFMNNFIPGDVVDVKNTGIQLDNMDGLTDWNMSWKQWLAGSALGQR